MKLDAIGPLVGAPSPSRSAPPRWPAYRPSPPAGTAGEPTGTATSAVRGVLTAPPVPAGLATLAITAFLAGFVLYAVVAALVICRLLRGQLAAPDITPPYWISMGGASITVFAALQLSSVTSAPVAGLRLGTSELPAVRPSRSWRSGRR